MLMNEYEYLNRCQDMCGESQSESQGYEQEPLSGRDSTPVRAIGPHPGMQG